MIEEKQGTNRWLIYILVALFGLIGGAVGWLYYRRNDPTMAKECVVAGIIGGIIAIFLL